jgi:hypothetical protein
MRNTPALPSARQMPKMAAKCARRVSACLHHGPLDSWAGVHVLCLSSSCLCFSYRVLYLRRA